MALNCVEAQLLCSVEFGTIMLWYYLADRTTVFGQNSKVRQLHFSWMSAVSASKMTPAPESCPPLTSIPSTFNVHVNFEAINLRYLPFSRGFTERRGLYPFNEVNCVARCSCLSL